MVTLRLTKHTVKRKSPMPIVIHPRLLDMLLESIAKVIEVAVLSDHTKNPWPAGAAFYAAISDAEGQLKSLPKATRPQLEEWVGPRPLATFATSYLVSKFIGAPRDDAKPGAPLTSVPEFSDSRAAAQRLLDAFMALPNHYVVTMTLPAAERASLPTPIEYGQLAVAGSWHERNARFPPVPESAARTEPISLFQLAQLTQLAIQPPAMKDEVALQIRVDGYVGLIAEEPVRRAKAEFKSFVGLALMTDLMTTSKGLIDANMAARSWATRVHEQTGAGWEPREITTDPLKELLPRVQFGLEAYVSFGVNSLLRLFAEPDVGKNLKLAGRWIYDASATTNEPVMRYMQFAIAMEVLLQSDPGDEGLTKALANRCAYLIAESAREREEIRNDFPILYKLRSQIVHNGTDRFSEDEYRKAARFERYCKRVVKEELKLALLDIDPEAKDRKLLIEALRLRSRDPAAMAPAPPSPGSEKPSDR